MENQRIEIPWPLAKGEYRDSEGRYCVLGWMKRNNTSYLRISQIVEDETGYYITMLNDGRISNENYDPGLTDVERLNLLFFGLLVSGFEPVVVDGETGKEMG